MLAACVHRLFLGRKRMASLGLATVATLARIGKTRLPSIRVSRGWRINAHPSVRIRSIAVNKLTGCVDIHLSHKHLSYSVVSFTRLGKLRGKMIGRRPFSRNAMNMANEALEGFDV